MYVILSLQFRRKKNVKKSIYIKNDILLKHENV